VERLVVITVRLVEMQQRYLNGCLRASIFECHDHCQGGGTAAFQRPDAATGVRQCARRASPSRKGGVSLDEPQKLAWDDEQAPRESVTPLSFRVGASVPLGKSLTLAPDEMQAFAGARLAPTSLLHL
jgi:hypothetical protein